MTWHELLQRAVDNTWITPLNYAVDDVVGTTLLTGAHLEVKELDAEDPRTLQGAHRLALGSVRYCSPRDRIPITSRHQSSKRVV